MRDGWLFTFILAMPLLPLRSEAAAPSVTEALLTQPGNSSFYPVGGLTGAPDGSLYGITGFDPSAIFKLAPPGKSGGPWQASNIHQFPSGSSAPSPLLRDSAGVLYQTFSDTLGNTSIYRLLPPSETGARWTYGTLFAFHNGGTAEFANVAAILNGVIYGMTQDRLSGSTIFALSPPLSGEVNWRYSRLYQSNPQTPPFSNLLARSVGGQVVIVGIQGLQVSPQSGGSVFMLTSPQRPSTAWTFATLHSFPYASSQNDPSGEIVVDRSLNIYGVLGGGYGSVFRLSPPAAGQSSWTFDILYHFKGGVDGSQIGGLVEDSSSRLYGTTTRGGSGLCQGSGLYYCGTVFQLTPRDQGGKTVPWNKLTLYDFTPASYEPDGYPLVLRPSSTDAFDLYGVNFSGTNVFDLHILH